MNNSISVIIPFYNSTNTLSKMLDSILSGALIPSEIILVDDGSTDSSKTLAQKYSDNHPFIHVISQKHSGVSAARNLGLASAHGEWISFLDADDFIEPDMYSSFHNAITTAPDKVDGCICGYYTHKDAKVTPYSLRNNGILSSDDLLHAMFTDDSVRGFLFTRLFSKSLLINILFNTKITVCEDLLFQTQLFSSKNINFASISKPLYHYVNNADSATSSNSLFENGIFKYRPAYDMIIHLNNSAYIRESYNSILEYSMYTLLKKYKAQRNPATLKQIRILHDEIKNHPDFNSIRSKRRFVFKHAPIFFSYFIK